MIEAAISLILRRRKYIMLRNLFILLTAIVMGSFTINSQYQEVKMHRIWLSL